jgi:hypothetical protein
MARRMHLRIRPEALMRKRGRLALPLALIPLFLPLSARAQNLLTNPGFDQGAAAWNTFVDVYPLGQPERAVGTVVWTADDAAGRPDSGGVAFRLRGGPQSTATVKLWQCVTIEPGRAYAAGGKVRIDRQQNAGDVFLLGFFPTTDCSGRPSAEKGAPVIRNGALEPGDMDGSFRPASLRMTAPTGCRSARVMVRASRSGTSHPSPFALESHVDDLYLIPEPNGSEASLLPTRAYSTVTDFARFRGWSTSQPR